MAGMATITSIVASPTLDDGSSRFSSILFSTYSAG